MFFKIGSLFVIKSLLKKTPTQVVSCEYCKSFKNSFFYRTPPAAALDLAKFKDLKDQRK